MDRIKAQHKSGAHLVANRYMLNDRLFASTLGTLYQARDTQAGSEHDKTQVLIHLFPARALGYTPLKITCTRLQQLGQRTNAGILPIIDCGWMGTEAYFVLESPQSWSLSALPHPQARLTSLHEKAIKLTQQLINQGLVREGLPAYLFLVTPDGDIHLPGTALSENLQALHVRNESFLFPALHTAKKRKHWLYSKGFWLSNTSIALASGLGFYSAQTLTEQHDNRFASGLNVRLPPPPIQTREVATEPAHDEPEQIILPIAPSSPASIPARLGQELIESIEQTRPSHNRFPPELLARLNPPTPASALIMEELVQNNTTAPVPVPQPALTPAPEPIPEPTPVPEPTSPPADTPVKQARPRIPPTTPQPPKNIRSVMPEPISPNIARTDSVPFVPVHAHQQQPIVSHTHPGPFMPMVIEPAPQVAAAQPAPQEPRPLQHTLAAATPPPVVNSRPSTRPPTSRDADRSDSPELTANGMTSAQLIQNAYAAIRQGKLDERANHGAVYFIRLLHRIDRGNPQIQRLAREVTYQCHQRARNTIARQEFDQAKRYLLMAERTIKEFNLVKLNPAQAVLEHKLAKE